MRKIEFEKTENSRADTIWLLIKYAGGDADTEHFHEEKFEFPYSEYETHLEEIEARVDQYKIIENLTDGSGGHQDHDYEDLVEKYGEEIAELYENVPNDPQGDYQFKTSLDSMKLIAYDEKCNKYEAWAYL